LPSPEALVEAVKLKVLGWSKVNISKEADIEKLLPIAAGSS
jgi:hypothetical protein